MGSGRERQGIKWHRLNAGLSMDALAVRSRVSRGTILSLEHGLPAQPRSVRRIAEALGVDPLALDRPGRDLKEPIRLADLRSGMALSLVDVEAATGIPRRTISRAEHGAPIHPRAAKALSDFYGCRVTDWYPQEPTRVPA